MNDEGIGRRDFLKAVGTVSAGLALSGYTSSAGEPGGKADKKNPIKNVLLIMVDQHRADCLGCYGNQIVQTPNIDKLAASGIRFNNAYTPTPVCTPARASIQCGLYAHKHGLRFNPERHSGGHDLTLSPQAHFFSPDLARKGWRLAHIGKWHIGKDLKPSDYGYEGVFYPGYGFPARHPHYRNYLNQFGVNGFKILEKITTPSGRWSYAGLQEGPPEASTGSYLAHQTVDAIKRFAGKGKPFFISCNFWGPHAPYRIPAKYYHLYKNAKIEPWPNFDCDLADKPEVIRRYGQYMGNARFHQ